MLGKRRKIEVPEGASPSTKLRCGVQDLYSSGSLSASRASEILGDAAAGGCSSCYHRSFDKHDGRPRTLDRALAAMSGSQWPQLFTWQVTVADREGQSKKVDLAFLLPHEWLHQMVQIGHLPSLQSNTVDSVVLKNKQRVEKEWGTNIIGLTLWGDGIPYNWDRSESIDAWTLSVVTLDSSKHKLLRVPFTVIPHHWVGPQTHNEILQVLEWSLTWMRLGKFPTTLPDNNPISGKSRVAVAGSSLGYVAAILEVRGDWKHFAEVLKLPHWQGKESICWRCSCTKEQITQVGDRAPWRLPENRWDTAALKMALLQQNRSLSPMFFFPGFDATMIRVDWLHCMDIGLAAQWCGAVLAVAVEDFKHLGNNMDVRRQYLFSSILNFYKETNVPHGDRLKILPLKRFRPEQGKPVLKAGAAVVRKLIPWFHNWVGGWPEHILTPTLRSIQHGMKALYMCYQMLSKDAPLEEFHVHAKRFAVQLVSLAEVRPQTFRVKPKLHLLMELSLEKSSSPSSCWTYRDEDFGGSLATFAVRRGGKDTPYATSSNTLKKCCLNQQMPVVE